MDFARRSSLSAEGVQVLLSGCKRASLQPLAARLQAQGAKTFYLDDDDLSMAQLRARGLDAIVAAYEGRRTDELLDASLRADPVRPVIILGEEADVGAAARLGRSGAADFLQVDPRFDPESSARLVERILEHCRRAAERRGSDPSSAAAVQRITGRSRAIQRVIETVRVVAPRQSTVLISGRTGSGKEVVARAMHESSKRRGKPLVQVNCGAIPATLIEAELFGHVRGAFTGAVQSRPGRFEQAHGGTIFLDEVGEAPLEMQPKLLRVLQERELQRVGGSTTIPVDVRVIAATNRDLAAMVRNGEFREDLYYRLNVVPIQLPDLSERAEDVPALAESLLDRICERERLRRPRIADEAMRKLQQAQWPGNVRQLENALEAAVALSGGRVTLSPSDFPLPQPPGPLTAPGAAPILELGPSGVDYDAVVGRFERNLIEQALRLTGGNKKRAADLLRLKRTTLTARWKALQESIPAEGGRTNAVGSNALNGALPGSAFASATSDGGEHRQR